MQIVDPGIVAAPWTPEAGARAGTSLLAFSKYLGHPVGGAERSTRTLLATRASLGQRVLLLAARDARFRGRRMAPEPLPEGWTAEWLTDLRQWARFPFAEYAANRSRLLRMFAARREDELWTYGQWAPAAARAFPGSVVFFIRSESDLGIVGNYHTGWRRAARALYGRLEAPALSRYRADLGEVLQRCVVVANSQYMARRARECFGVEARVRLPDVDVEQLRRPLAAAGIPPRWVVFVGDNVYKGLPLVRRLAQRMPDVPFRIVSRLTGEARTEGNVHWMPWTAEVWRVFAGARAVIMPSQWEEAYGRIARKAVLLDIPVLVSATGGLPEAVDHDPRRIVRDFRSVDAWEGALRRMLEEHA